MTTSDALISNWLRGFEAGDVHASFPETSRPQPDPLPRRRRLAWTLHAIATAGERLGIFDKSLCADLKESAGFLEEAQECIEWAESIAKEFTELDFEDD